MKKFIVFSIVLLILSAIQSCKKDGESSARIDMKELWDCNAAQNFDSAKLASKLIGAWKWTAQSCYGSGYKTNLADKNVKVTFTSTGTFTVMENSIIVTQGNWKLKIQDVTIYGLDLDHTSEYLHGRILLCDNRVLFNASYIDGCDNLFVRIP